MHDELSTGIDRRELFRRVAAIAAATSIGRLETVGAQQARAPTSRFFPGFARSTVQTSGTTINVVKGGEGPPLLLLHGAPQSHLSWRLVAPQLAKESTVVATDLRGYGDSGKLPDGEDHSNYSKRTMALDQVEVMRHFGFDRFPVVGPRPRRPRRAPDGARSSRQGDEARRARHHPDVLPLHPRHDRIRPGVLPLVQLPSPGAGSGERPQRTRTTAQKARATTEIQLEYLRTSSDPANIHAMCEDYRAAASIDLKHDEADLNKKITAPLLTLWGEKGSMGRSTMCSRSGASAARRSPGKDCLADTIFRKMCRTRCLRSCAGFCEREADVRGHSYDQMERRGTAVGRGPQVAGRRADRQMRQGG